MDALLMCGGRGTRLDTAVEKPLVELCGRSMFDRVVDALRDSCVNTTYAVVSEHSARTRARARERGVRVIDAPGEGYVADLGFALERVDRPVVTVVSDLPLLQARHVDDLVAAADGGSCTACVPVSLKRRLGASIDDSLVFDYRGTDVCPTGLGVVAPAPPESTPDSVSTSDPVTTPNSASTPDHSEPDSTVYLSTDDALALNVNRPTDIELAEDRCA
ncbi:NTP transferase domain-containing protein [Haloferax namakaokahaiae]|uniref:NTP transferase domain-containing protein n=1 Tax=Haloferax namakaokahaiae TaxID=1748331 RepID=A0ABD5ZH13_9EURY